MHSYLNTHSTTSRVFTVARELELWLEFEEWSCTDRPTVLIEISHDHIKLSIDTLVVWQSDHPIEWLELERCRDEYLKQIRNCLPKRVIPPDLVEQVARLRTMVEQLQLAPCKECNPRGAEEYWRHNALAGYTPEATSSPRHPFDPKQ